ncbi:MFS transporter [Nocardia sp. bgisy118]|uniref:MFS transporter n=1 Tax=Nocardia sp. bgisy118 TaxID=3413786 RepID=UPI003F4A82D4
MPTETETPSARRWLGLIAVALGVALIVVDLTIVNVIIAPIIDDLGITSIEAQWIQESYAIVFAALLLLTGRLADLYGARRLFVIGLAIFGVTSLLAAASPTGVALIAARFLQGVGGAMILPTSLALVNCLFAVPSFRNGNVVTIVVGVGEFGIIAVLPLWLQFTLGYTAFQTGLALAALAVGSFCASGASFSMTASAMAQVRIGLLLEAAGLALLALVAAADTPWWA